MQSFGLTILIRLVYRLMYSKKGMADSCHVATENLERRYYKLICFFSYFTQENNSCGSMEQLQAVVSQMQGDIAEIKAAIVHRNATTGELEKKQPRMYYRSGTGGRCRIGAGRRFVFTARWQHFSA